MKKSGIYLSIVVLTTVSLLGVQQDKFLKSRIADFALEDQFETEHQIQFPVPKAMIMIFYRMSWDSEPYEESLKWQSHFQKQTGDSAKILLIGAHATIPFFMKSIVRSYLEDKEKILIDWGGDIAEKYGFDEGVRILCVTKDGVIEKVIEGHFEQVKL